MDYGFTITKQGWKLLAKLLTGSQLEITKVMVGSGKVPEGASPGEMTGLVQPVALATSTIPQVENEQVSFIVEYRSDLNGGLKEGFWLNEFGVFANDPDAGEVLLYYATMGDYPQYVSAFSGSSVDIRRYPVSIALSESPEVHLDYPAGALVTAEEMEEALDKQGVPSGGLAGQMLIKASNQDYATEWGPWPSNPNLLLNWDFRNPVNRNGKREYSGAGYSIDRWRLNTSDVLSMNLEPDNIALSVSGAINGYPYIVYTFEYPEQYIGKQMTFSVLIKNPDGLAYLLNAKQASNGAGFTRVENPEGTIQEGYTLMQCTGMLPANSTNFYLFLYVGQLGTISGTLHVKAIKAELGNQQTLAHKEGNNWVLNDPPNFDLQYTLCSQYSPSTGEFVSSQHSNPNLLDNAYWADRECIINQRGQDKYTDTGYAIDRWKNFSANFKTQLFDSYIRLTAKNTNNGKFIVQIMENPQFYAGKMVTLSVLVRRGGNAKVNIRITDSALNMSYLSAITTDDNFVLVTVTGTLPDNLSNGIGVILGIDNDRLIDIDNAYVDIKAAKLELGPVQTLAHKEGDTWVLNDPPPNKALELAKCQRYAIGNLRGYRIIETQAKDIGGYFFPTPTTMRSTLALAKIYLENDIGTGNLLEKSVINWSLFNNGIYANVNISDLTDAQKNIYKNARIPVGQVVSADL